MRGVALPALLALSIACAPAARAEECGASSGSFAEVVEGSRGRGPVVSRPGSLCADLPGSRAPTHVDVQVVIPPQGADAQGERQGARRR